MVNILLILPAASVAFVVLFSQLSLNKTHTRLESHTMGSSGYAILNTQVFEVQLSLFYAKFRSNKNIKQKNIILTVLYFSVLNNYKT